MSFVVYVLQTGVGVVVNAEEIIPTVHCLFLVQSIQKIFKIHVSLAIHTRIAKHFGTSVFSFSSDTILLSVCLFPFNVHSFFSSILSFIKYIICCYCVFVFEGCSE